MVARLLVRWFIGVGGVIDPRVLGVGCGDTIHALMRGEFLGAAIIGLLIAKALVWSIALGSGTSGGVPAPLLIIGVARVGRGVGWQWLPVGDPGLWAMIGMAAMMGGTMRSPLTGIFFVLELSHDLNALPALLVGTVAALGVTVLPLRRSILTEKLARRGQHIAREYSVDLLELMRVGEVMDKEVPTIPADHDRDRAFQPDRGRRSGHVAPPGNAHSRQGKQTRGHHHARRHSLGAARNISGTMTVLEAGETELIVAYADESLHDATARMLKHDIGRLPVVDRQDSRRVIGYLGRASILAARSRFNEEEEVRGRGPIIPSALEKALAGIRPDKLLKKNGADARANGR